MGHFAAYKPHCGVFVVLVGCIKLLTTAALTENGRARRGFDLFAFRVVLSRPSDRRPTLNVVRRNVRVRVRVRVRARALSTEH